MQRDLHEASIVLAGASGGLGSALAHRLHKEGARLVLMGRDQGRLSALAVPGERVLGCFSEAGTCERAVKAALTGHGRLDGVVNAAGVVAFGEVAGLADPVLDAMLLANLVGPVRLARAALPHLQDGGFIANLSAIVAEKPTAGMALYSATKAGLSAFDHALARETRRRHIDIIDVRPPHIETGLADRPLAGIAPRLPLGLDPDVVAERILAAIRSGQRELASGDFAPARV